MSETLPSAEPASTETTFAYPMSAEMPPSAARETDAPHEVQEIKTRLEDLPITAISGMRAVPLNRTNTSYESPNGAMITDGLAVYFEMSTVDYMSVSFELGGKYTDIELIYAGFDEKTLKDYAPVIEIYGDGAFVASVNPAFVGGETSNYAEISLGFADLTGVQTMTVKVANTTNYLTVFKDDSPPNGVFLETFLIGEQPVAPPQESSATPTESGTEPASGAAKSESATKPASGTAKRVYLEDFESFAVSDLTFNLFGESEDDGYTKTNTGKTFEHGVYANKSGSRSYALEGNYQLFAGTLALSYKDKDSSYAYVNLAIYGDGVLLETVKTGKGQLPVDFAADIANVQVLKISVEKNIHYLLGDTYFE
jgi:hypothetical protein